MRKKRITGTTFPIFFRDTAPAIIPLIGVLIIGIFIEYSPQEIFAAMKILPEQVNDVGFAVHRIFSGFNWLTTWDYAFLSWQVTSLVCLIIHWWKLSYVVKYFPITKWWFWAYGALALPWSFILVFLVAFPYILRGAEWTFSGRWRASHRSEVKDYDTFCASLRKDLPETRRRWEAFFPKNYAKANIPVLERRTEALKEQLRQLGTQMEELQREYAEAQANIRVLKQREDIPAGDSATAVSFNDWKREFDILVHNPHVKGLRIVDEKLEIYTGVFKTFWGKFGPVEITINKLYDGFTIGRLHEKTWTDNQGRSGGSGFCFGDNGELIQSLIFAGKISEAFGLMTEAFEASGEE